MGFVEGRFVIRGFVTVGLSYGVLLRGEGGKVGGLCL